MNGHKKLVFMLILSSLVYCNTLTYWAILLVTNKMKCCEYGD
jgi:hypothetical protein